MTLQAADESAWQAETLSEAQSSSADSGSIVGILDSPPKVALTQDADEDSGYYLSRQRRVAIRHRSGDKLVAVIEIVSPGNKQSRRNLNEFIDKVTALLAQKIHVLIVDPFPPSELNPDGFHGAVWDRLLAGTYQQPRENPLTLVSYSARVPITAYVEPIAVGDGLVDMPLFLLPEHYISSPLEVTYSAAYSGVPKRWTRVIEGEQ